MKKEIILIGQLFGEILEFMMNLPFETRRNPIALKG